MEEFLWIFFDRICFFNRTKNTPKNTKDGFQCFKENLQGVKYHRIWPNLRNNLNNFFPNCGIWEFGVNFTFKTLNNLPDDFSPITRPIFHVPSISFFCYYLFKINNSFQFSWYFCLKFGDFLNVRLKFHFHFQNRMNI